MTGGGKTLRFHVIFTFPLTSTSASVRADEFSESIFDLLKPPLQEIKTKKKWEQISVIYA